jgi:DNA-binding response OmpR family regulator
LPSRILIVEDEQIIAADLEDKLVRMGHEVVGMAIEGGEAVSMADQVKPDLVLMDIQIEGQMSGTEAAQQIRERTGASIIFVTAFPSVFLREMAEKRDPGICLGKPFSRVQLEAAVGAALNNRGVTRKPE